MAVDTPTVACEAELPPEMPADAAKSILFRLRAAFNSQDVVDKNLALRRAHDLIEALTGPARDGGDQGRGAPAPDHDAAPSIGDCGLAVMGILQSFARTINAHPQPTPPTVESFEPWHRALDEASREIVALMRRFAKPAHPPGSPSPGQAGEDDLAALSARATPWKPGQHGYAREAVVIQTDEQIVEVGVTSAGRVDLIVHRAAGDGGSFDDLTARLSREDAVRVARAIGEAAAQAALDGWADRRPNLGCPTDEPSIREILRRYYAPHFQGDKAAVLADEYIAALSVAQAAPDGYVMVPREPVGQMVIAGTEARSRTGSLEGSVNTIACWRAMLAAAPAAPAQGGRDGWQPISKEEIVTLIAKHWLTAKGTDEDTAAELSAPSKFPRISPEDHAACCEVADALLARLPAPPSTEIEGR